VVLNNRLEGSVYPEDDPFRIPVTEEMLKAAQNQQNETKIIFLAFSSDAYEAMEKLARSTNRQISTVLRDAIAFERWYWNTRDKKYRLLVDNGRGNLTEIIRPRGPGLTSLPKGETTKATRVFRPKDWTCTENTQEKPQEEQ
jgi:hypothetical protein